MSIKKNNKELKFKLDLKKNLILYDPKITGIFYKKVQNIKYNLELNLVKKQKGYFNFFYENRNLFFNDKGSYIYDYYFLRESKLLKIKKQPIYLYFYRYYEIFKKFISDDHTKKYDSLYCISIYNNNNLMEKIYEVFKFLNYKINIFELNNSKNNTIEVIQILNMYNLIDTHKNIVNFTKYDIIFYNDLYFIEKLHKSIMNTINVFIGLLFGLKYTNLGGTFILCVGTVYSNQK